MSLSETVKHQVETVLRTFCEKRVPPEVRDKVRLTYDFRGNAVAQTIFEEAKPFTKSNA